MAYDQIIVKGATSNMIEVMLRSSTTGMALTGVAYGSAAYSYWREGAASGTHGTCVTASLGTYTDHGWVEVDSVNQPGIYQFGIPDAACASGANAVTVCFVVTGAISARFRVILVAADLRDGVHLGLTSLPNAAANAANGLPTFGTGAGQINASGGAVPATVTGTPAVNATQIGGTVQTTGVDLVADVVAVKAKTDNLPASPMAAGNVTVGGYAANEDPATLLLVTPANKLATDGTGRVTAGTVSDKTGYSLAADQAVNATKIGGTAQTGGDVGSLVATVGAAGAGLTALGDTRLAHLNADMTSRAAPGSQMDLVNAPNATALTAIATAVWALTTRTLSSFGTLAADAATAVWGAATRTLSAFGFSVTAGTVSDKTGYALTSAYDAAKTAAQAGEAASAIAAASLATAASVAGLHNLSITDVQTAAATAITAAALATAASVAALHNVSTGDILAQAGTALTNYGAATGAEVSALHNVSTSDVQTAAGNAIAAAALATAAEIAALHNLSSSDVIAAVASELATYGASTATEVAAVGTAVGNLTAPLTATQTAQAVLNAAQATYETAGTIGASIAAAEAPTVEDIDAQLSGAHGAGAWGGAAGSGSNTVPIYVTDGSHAVVGAQVTVKNTAESATIAGPLRTDINGNLTPPPQLDDGTYHVLVTTTPAYAPLAAHTLVVSGTPGAPLTLTLTAVVLPTPTDPNDCYVYVDLPDTTGTPQPIYFQLSKATGHGSAMLTGQPQAMVQRDGDPTGRWSIELEQGATYNLTAPGLRLGNAVSVVIPAASGAELTSLVPGLDIV